MGRFDIRTRLGLLSAIIQGQSASPSDGDAQAFIFRVEAAGGTLTTTEKNSINTLVVRLKAANIWTKLLAVYPMVGASAAACAQNLKSSSFTGAFTSGWTFASTGATPNGSSAFMETNFNPRTSTTGFSQHMAMYSRTQNSSVNGMQMGCTPVGAEMNLYLYYASSAVKGTTMYIYPGTAVTVNNTTTTGFQIGSKTGSNSLKLYFNGSLLATSVSTESLTRPDRTIYLGASKGDQGAFNFSPHEHAFDSLGDGLTDTEASDYYNIVQEFQTLLGRQIGAPSVSDPDASAFIQRVYTAGGTLTTAEQNAVNQLTIDLKAASIWTSMKAVYPMVGSSAAACAQNLVTSSFTGTFSGGVTYAATGITGNGTTGYMSTALTPSVTLTNANHHISFYSRTNAAAGTSVEMGTYEPSYGYAGPAMRAKNASNQIQYLMGTATAYFDTTSSNADSRGLFIGNILSISNRKTYKNGSVSGTNTGTSTAFSGTGPIYVLAVNGYPSTAGSFSTKEFSFASIGDGLTDTQAVYLNNAVETFQTSLSRNVGALIPTVSDSDATDFIARVYGAGGTLSTLECNAVNQLAISMKATGVWNSTKAVYPMVGASAAACAQNLRSDSFTGAFTGGWAYSSTGITGNGTNTYLNTTLVPSTQLSQNSAHLAAYLRVTNSSNHYLMGSVATYVANYGFAAIHNADQAAINTAGQTGFFLNSRLMSTQFKQYKNNSTLGTYTITSASPTVHPIFVGAGNNGVALANPVNGQIAFASIGDGLTDTQESDYYSAVQAFQTTLSRQV
jgi:hypothetical protein